MPTKTTKVTIEININKKGVTRLKIDGPNKKIEKEVGENMIKLLNQTSQLLYGNKIKVLKKGFTKNRSPCQKIKATEQKKKEFMRFLEGWQDRKGIVLHPFDEIELWLAMKRIFANLAKQTK